jgi:hypothetical protein
MLASSTKTKLIACAVGVLIALLTNTAQTPENLRAYLAGQGYAEIDVQGPAKSCGKHKSAFAFTARKQDTRQVQGTVCMGSYPSFYNLRETS